MKVVLVGAYA